MRGREREQCTCEERTAAVETTYVFTNKKNFFLKKRGEERNLRLSLSSLPTGERSDIRERQRCRGRYASAPDYQ